MHVPVLYLFYYKSGIGASLVWTIIESALAPEPRGPDTYVQRYNAIVDPWY